MPIFKGVGLLIGLPAIAIALFYVWASAGSYDPQKYAAVLSYFPPEGQIEGGIVEAREAASHTIVSYNIGYLSGLANNTTTQPSRQFFEDNQQRAIAALKSVNPDIVAFQEIDFEAKRSYGVNQAEAIAQAMELHFGAIAINWDKNYLPFPYWPPSAHFGKILSGQAVMSRYPIEKNSRLVLETVTERPFYYKAFYLDRVAQVTQLNVLGQPLIVINVHLEAFEEDTRVRQTQFVRAIAQDYAKTYPVLVLGDFNSALNRSTFVAATGQTYQENQFSIQEMLDSAQFASAVPLSEGEGASKTFTFPADAPEYKLDYVFYTPSTLEILDTQVVSAAGESSDHLPLMVTFRFKPTS